MTTGPDGAAGTDPVVAFRPDRVPVPVLARTAHDRLDARRSDADWVATQWAAPTSRVLLLSAAGRTPVQDRTHLQVFTPDEASRILPSGLRVLLGSAAGVTYFALLAYTESATAEVDTEWRGLRDLAVELDDLQVGLLTAAVALAEWHHRHGHCPRCGAVTVVERSGWSRRCPVDASEHFPRTDPAVIMLIDDGVGRCLLGRGPQWPPGRMSVLAGFVEAGESAEAAVVREVAEEVGIAIRDVRYVASQPHPFPASLMLGFTARLDGPATLSLDRSEIVEAGWFTRAEIARAGDWDGGNDPTAAVAEPANGPDGERPMLVGLPGRMSIARQLIDTWVAAGD